MYTEVSNVPHVARVNREFVQIENAKYCTLLSNEYKLPARTQPLFLRQSRLQTQVNKNEMTTFHFSQNALRISGKTEDFWLKLLGQKSFS